MEKFYNNIKDKINDKIILNIKDQKSILERMGITKQWDYNQISNYQYLLYLNKYSGRTYNDTNQYPIFPWVILSNKYINVSKIKNKINNDDNDNDEQKNENEEETNDSKIYFRDMQTQEGIENAKQNYRDVEKESPNKGFHFALHYSTGGYVLLYLMRLSPFMDMHIKFQSGKFDNPNRLIFFKFKIVII